jgi:hypothetical protein
MLGWQVATKRGRRGDFPEAGGSKRIFWPGGHHNPLKRLISAMEIQDNQSAFLGRIWPELALAWLGFDGFGIGLRNLIQERADERACRRRSASAAVDATPAFMISVSRYCFGRPSVGERCDVVQYRRQDFFVSRKDGKRRLRVVGRSQRFVVACHRFWRRRAKRPEFDAASRRLGRVAGETPQSQPQERSGVRRA